MMLIGSFIIFEAFCLTHGKTNRQNEINTKPELTAIILDMCPTKKFGTLRVK